MIKLNQILIEDAKNLCKKRNDMINIINKNNKIKGENIHKLK